MLHTVISFHTSVLQEKKKRDTKAVNLPGCYGWTMRVYI